MPEPAPYAYAFDPDDLAQATNEARDRVHRAQARMARVTCALIAASVRDVLTDNDPDPTAPFDAAHLRLHLYPSGRVGTDGTYWTIGGKRRRLDMLDLFDLIHWTQLLNTANRQGWEPLCAEEEDHAHHDLTSFRLDLARAAALPASTHSSARVAEVRDRLAASTRRPWSSEEFAYNRGGGLVSSGDPEAVHTDFVVSDADGIKVAELAVNHDGPEDTETPEEDIATTRANADLIARAPEDLAFLVACLAHVCGGKDAEAAHLRGYCGHCGTALYTSALDPTPAPLDNTECLIRHLPGGSALQLQHVLRT
ncbi:hypothetical protein ID875_20995 [Streptomyces globisporus]|uniref:Uncharacterized protein n=1 Tax=Streptomyces globisporus TaxID=1908 RepID=A0A927GNY3_STRGL|nr:hypothetical protein [Streptomyces globisporus]